MSWDTPRGMSTGAYIGMSLLKFKRDNAAVFWQRTPEPDGRIPMARD